MPHPANARTSFADRGKIGWHHAGPPQWSRPRAPYPAVPITARVCVSEGWLVALVEGAGWAGTAATQGRDAAELRSMVGDLVQFATGRTARAVRYVRDSSALE